MKKHQRELPIGPRMFKTALAVTLSVFIVRLFADDSLTVFYAAFGALIAMETTLSKSLMQGLTQLIGVFAGTVCGYVSVLLFPTLTPAWVAGLGVLFLLFLCRSLRLSFTASLSCIIFLSACLTPTDNILRDSLYRLRDTSIGLGVALVINGLIRPYNNKKRILGLLAQLRSQMPPALRQIIVEECIPDLSGNLPLLRRLDREMELYHSQRFFHRKNDDEALLAGCKQLAERMVEELEAICGMDTPGNLAKGNAALMRELGLELPEEGISGRKCTRHDTIVLNYHLEKLLTAYRFLGELMEEA
ncbi:MAG: FUSC family protein [Oscillospiraceae bacterium]|nr:FUSC family protein [Oscillospiraceae bacterium]